MATTFDLTFKLTVRDLLETLRQTHPDLGPLIDADLAIVQKKKAKDVVRAYRNHTLLKFVDYFELATTRQGREYLAILAQVDPSQVPSPEDLPPLPPPAETPSSSSLESPDAILQELQTHLGIDLGPDITHLAKDILQGLDTHDLPQSAGELDHKLPGMMKKIQEMVQDKTRQKQLEPEKLQHHAKHLLKQIYSRPEIETLLKQTQPDMADAFKSLLLP